MTERKPVGMGFESWVEKQISEAATRGEFENLPGAGKPLPGAGSTDDENWWLRSYLSRHEVSVDSLLPAPMLLRKEIEQLRDAVRELPTEERVRATVHALNSRITESWRLPSGPQPHVRLLNADAVVTQWREDSAEASTTLEAAAPSDPVPGRSPAGLRWWRRLRRRPSR
jgi:hypothetical protein